MVLQNNCLSNIKSYTEGALEGHIKYMDKIHSYINTSSLPSVQAKPFGLFQDRFTSSYAINDYWCASGCWDVEDRDSFFARECYTFDFKVRTLVSSFQHKFNNLYLYEPNSSLHELLNITDDDDFSIKTRHEYPSQILYNFKGNDTPRIRVQGQTGFWEERLA